MQKKVGHIEILSPDSCCGCTACASICAHDAISMQPDALGFLYPKVDESKCLDCGLCTMVCAFHPDYDKSSKLPKPIVYGAVLKDDVDLQASQSGGAFTAISNYVLEHGGVVYGAGYDNHFKVVHKRVDTKADRDELRGSKYVQSDLTGVFKNVKEDLSKGLLVLFSGTACQIAGLKAYVGKKNSENLFLVDIICHGVPAPYVWRDYLTYLETQEHDIAESIRFRDKVAGGWNTYVMTVRLKNTHKTVQSELYSDIFFSDLCTRYSCGHCPFSNTIRPGDITLGDFWNYKAVKPEANRNNMGVSVVLCNTNKGVALFDQSKHIMEVFEVKTDAYLQNRLLSHITLPKERKSFEEYYIKHGITRTLKHYRLIGWQRKLDEMLQRQKRRIVKYSKKYLHIDL